MSTNVDACFVDIALNHTNVPIVLYYFIQLYFPVAVVVLKAYNMVYVPLSRFVQLMSLAKQLKVFDHSVSIKETGFVFVDV